MLEKLLDFSTVLNTSIAASWLILVILILRIIFKKSPKWVHVAMWGLVAFRLLFPFSIESSLSLIPSAQTLPEEILRYEGERLREQAYLEVVTNPSISKPVIIELSQSVERVQINEMYMNLLWWGGMLLLLAYTVVSYVRLAWKVRTAVRLQDNIFQSEYIETPFVMGVIRPRIYMPYQIKGKDMAYVLAHEQAHIRRGDYWWKPLGFVLLTIHWFNPLMWLAYSLFCKDIELACDEQVVKTLNREQRVDYSQALLTCSVNRRGIAACPLAFGEVGVFERVKNVLNYRKPAFWLLLSSVLACVVLALCFLTDPVGSGKVDAATNEYEGTTEVNQEVESDIQNEENTEIQASLKVDGFLSKGYENYTDDYNDHYIVNYQVKLGDMVKDGHIYVEQWYGGKCVKGIPAMISETTGEINIRMSTNRDATGGSVSVWMDDFAGEWVVDFDIPADDYMYGWKFETFGLNEIQEIQPNDEKILAILAYDNGKLRDSVLKEPGKLKEEVGYAVVVRAVFGEGAPVEELHESESTTAVAADEKDWYEKNVLDLTQAVEVKNKEQKMAYIAALEDIIYSRILPDGYETSPVSSTKFVLSDIDSDGSTELLLVHESIMADTFFAIYDYDEVARGLYCELMIFPTYQMYDNGVVEAFASHNHGMAPGTTDLDFWPYSLYQYNKKTDIYEYVVNVDGWERNYAETSWTGDSFQEKADLDGDGVLYYIMTDGEYNYDEPVDGAEYQKWRESVLGEPMEQNLQYIQLTYVFPEAEA